MADETFDDFFDSPRTTINATKTNLKHQDAKCFPSYNTAKPPAHPNSRPTSAVSRKSVLSPVNTDKELTVDDDVKQSRETRRVIEAKVPCMSANEEREDVDSDAVLVESDASDGVNEPGRRAPTPRKCRLEDCDNSVSRDSYSEESVGSDHEKDHDYVSMRKGKRNENKDCCIDINSFSGDTDEFSDELTDDSEGEDDDDSDMTDVSPLNTPHDRLASGHNEGNKLVQHRQNKQKESRLNGAASGIDCKSRGLMRAGSDLLDLNSLLRTVLDIESNTSECNQTNTCVRAAPVKPGPAKNSRKNFSFSQGELRSIDAENRRLMNALMKYASNGKKQKKTAATKTRPPSTTMTVKRPSSAALNRQRELQRIESENLMLLKRLQGTRPTRELQRSVLMGSSFSATSRPPSAASGHTVASGSMSRPASGKRSRPQSAQLPGTHSLSQNRPQTHQHSRPGTAFAEKPGDDDIPTWESGW